MRSDVMKYLQLFCCAGLILSCNSSENKVKLTETSTKRFQSNYSGIVMALSDSSYSYQIIKDGKTRIHQRFLPALEGKKPIKDSISAAKLLQISLNKINAGQFPPSLSVSEVRSCIE